MVRERAEDRKIKDALSKEIEMNQVIPVDTDGVECQDAPKLQIYINVTSVSYNLEDDNC